MAICNLFNKLNKTAGNFLLFSQYTEDLTRSNVHPGAYRVVPSHFVVMDVDYGKFKPFTHYPDIYQDPNVEDVDKNISVPTYFQNYFENGCAFLKENSNKIINETQIPEWTSDISSNLFWNAMYDANMIKINEDETCENIKYIGDINIQSYNEYLGTGYSEIYCSIPTESKAQIIKCDTHEPKLFIEYDKSTILGYKEDEYDETIDMCKLNFPAPFKYYFDPYFAIDFLNETEKYQDNPDITEYEFNTIVILYDTYYMRDGEYILDKTNIPMGMYICGTINGSTTSNPGKKIVSNADIYGLGTSYGLRICSKFVTTPNNENIKPIDVSIDDNNSYSKTCAILSELSKSIVKMNEISEQCIKNSQISKDLLDIFKNSRTNVPYIKRVGDINYWFINGKNTYVPVHSGGSVDVESITKQYIDSLFQQMRLRSALGYK